MKVTILGPAYPYRGGIAASDNRLATQFCADGHDTDVFSFNLQYPSIFFPGKQQKAEGMAPKNICIYNKVNSINPFNWHKIGNELSKSSPELLLIRFWVPFMAPAFGYIARRVRKNHKTTIICLADSILPSYRFFLSRIILKYFIRPVHGFVTMSEEVSDELRFFCNTKPIITSVHPIYDHYGEAIDPDLAYEKLNLDRNKKYILFFGQIRDYKGLDILLDAMPQINPNIHLIIAGEFFSNESQTLAHIEDLKISERVHIYGNYIPDKDITLYFSAADLAVLPYKKAKQSGVSQLAWHFDIPMIVTNVGELKNMVPNEKVGYVVNPDYMEIAFAVNTFFEENKAAEMKKNLKEFKPNLVWQTLTQRISEIYNIINRKPNLKEQ